MADLEAGRGGQEAGRASVAQAQSGKRAARMIVSRGVGHRGLTGWYSTVINMEPGWRGLAVCVCGWIVAAETYAIAKRSLRAHGARCPRSWKNEQAAK